MRVAALDLGSNTFILLIADVEKEKLQVVLDETKIVRLGQNLFETKSFHPDALKRADVCLGEFSKLIKKHKVDKTVSAATSASRDAKNKEEFFALGAKHEIPINVISGDDEARLTYLGAGGRIKGGEKIIVIDVGGGSTEVVGKNKLDEVCKHSFDLGCVRLNEKFLTKHPVIDSELNALKEFIAKTLSEKKDFLQSIAGQKIVAVAGTPTTVADIIHGGGFNKDKIQNYFIGLDEWESLLHRLQKLSLEERIKIPGMTKGREDVIISGMIILLQLTKILGQKGFYVSTQGVRYGLALDTATHPDA